MKKWSMFLAAAACACILASPLQAAERKKVNISFPTAATTGALYPLGAGIANLWNTKLGYVNARVQASNGGIQNLNLLKAGNAQVSFAVSSITYEALNGERGFKDRAYKDVRVLAGLYYNPNQVVARADSGVASLADFKGKSFAPGAAGGRQKRTHCPPSYRHEQHPRPRYTCRSHTYVYTPCAFQKS